jgi:hypothetical protein
MNSSNSNQSSEDEDEKLVDWHELRRILWEMEDAINKGKWNEALFHDLVNRASIAGNDDPDLYDSLFNHAEEEWIT